MQAISKITFLTVLVGLLVIVNAVMLAMLWQGPPGAGRPDRLPPGGPARFLTRTLDLTPAQERQFATLRHEHRAAMERLRPQMRALKGELFGQLAQPATPAVARSRALARIAANQRAIDSVTVAHFAAVRALLTPAQQRRFDEVAPELPRMLLAGPPPGGGPPGGPPDGPPPGP